MNKLKHLRNGVVALVLATVLLSPLAFTGCSVSGQKSAQKIAYTTLTNVGYTTDAALKSYLDLVARDTVKADGLPKVTQQYTTFQPTLEKKPDKYVMVPAHARKLHPLVEKHIKDLEIFAEEFPENRMEMQDTAVGIIASGTCYQYAKEAFPEYSFLKLGMVYPLPKNKIREFAQKVKQLYAFEELDPFFEEQVKALGIEILGKEVFPLCGEFDPHC